MLRAGLASLGGIPMINLTETPLSAWYGPVKQIADVVGALLALVVLSPLAEPFSVLLSGRLLPMKIVLLNLSNKQRI